MFEDGGQRRDFVHVSDVARANVAAVAATAPAAGFRAYNVASGTPATVGEMAPALAARAATGPSRWSPASSGPATSGTSWPHRPAPAAELGFRARVSLADGMTAFASAPLRG